MSEKQVVESLDLGLRLIDLLESRDAVTLTVAAASVGMSRSAVHRAMSTLESRGFAILTGGRRGYSAGPRLLARTFAALDASARDRHRRAIADVRRLTGESVHTAILVGSQVLVVDGRRSAHALDIGLRVGMIAPASAMAGGKLLLAHLSDNQVRALHPRENLDAPGPKSLTARSELLYELRQIRRDGYAVSVQESERGVTSVSVLLEGDSWATRVALVVSVPIERGSWPQLRALIEVVRGALGPQSS